MSGLMIRRNIYRYTFATLTVIALGLASRRFPGLFPAALGKYPGDALWALMIFGLGGMALPRASTLNMATLTLITCYAVEFSQLYQAPWANTVRSTALGHLVLGSGFNWLDLVAYAAGVLVGVTLERAFNWIPRVGRNRETATSPH
jgi:hypothetical protein